MFHFYAYFTFIGPTCHFYKLIELNVKADAKTIVNKMVEQFTTDGIWPIIETRLKAFTSDGANV